MDTGNRVYPFLHGALSVVFAWFASLTPTEWAASMAAMLNFLLICDWWWKRFWRPLAMRRGWIKMRARREEEFMASSKHGSLDEH